MKTFREIKKEVAASYGYSGWDMLLKGSLRVQEIEEEAAKRYAREAIAEHLERAAREGIRFRDLEDDDTRELYENIRNVEIILK